MRKETFEAGLCDPSLLVGMLHIRKKIDLVQSHCKHTKNSLLVEHAYMAFSGGRILIFVMLLQYVPSLLGTACRK